MKKVWNSFELFIDYVQQSKHWSTMVLTVLLVLMIGAGSLYMLLNTKG